MAKIKKFLVTFFLVAFSVIVGACGAFGSTSSSIQESSKEESSFSSSEGKESSSESSSSESSSSESSSSESSSSESSSSESSSSESSSSESSSSESSSSESSSSGDIGLTEEEIAQLSDEEYFAEYFTPNVRFSVASDVHIGNQDTEIEEARFAAFFQTAYEYAAGQDYTLLDGAFIAGDIGDVGSDKEFSKFKTILNQNARSETKTRVILGNHEFRTSGAIERLKSTFGYATDDEHAVINGYHFLFLSQDNKDSYSAADAEWLEEELAKAAATDPTGKKPIFIFQHEPNEGTVTGGVIENLYDIIKPYPQVVDFAGHTHQSIKDPRGIHQKDFTSVTTGGLSIYAMYLVNSSYPYAQAIGQEEGYTGAFSPDDDYPTKNMAQYWIVEADARGAIVLKGYDITGDKVVVEYRLRSVGDTSKFTYTEDRESKAAAPTFAESATLIVKKISNKKRIEVKVPQANANEYINNYRVELYKDGKLIDTKYALSGMFFANAPDKVQVAFTGIESGEYTLKAYAVSCWGQESAPLVSTITFTAQEVVNSSTPRTYKLEYDQNAVQRGEWYGRGMQELNFGTQYAGEVVTIKMDVNGTLSAENPDEVVGIRCFYNDCTNNQRLISIPAAALSTTDTWTTIYANVRLNENGAIWLSAEGRSAMGVYTINVQNISMIEDGQLVTTSKTSGWNGNVVKVSFGEAYANKKVLVSANVAGNITTAASGVSIGFGVFADEAKGKHINYVTLDKADVVSLNTFNKTAFVLTLNEKGEAYLAASRTNNAGDCGAITLIFKDIELLGEVEYSGIYDRALAGGGWAGSAFSFDFGAGYANKTVKVTMKVAGTAALEGDAKLGFYGYDANGNALGVKYYLTRDQISSYTDWTEVTFLWTLDGEGKFNTVMAATASTYENYHLFIKDVVCEEAGDYGSTTSGWAGNFFELDFSDVQGVEAESQVKIQMQIYGIVADGADTRTPLGFTSYTSEGNDGVHRGYFAFSDEIRSGEWRTVQITIKLSEAKKIFLAASRTGNTGNNVSFSILVRNVVLQEIDGVEIAGKELVSGSSGWSGAVQEFDFGSEYANKTVLISMKLKGDLTNVSSGASIGLSAFADANKDTHIKYITLDKTDIGADWRETAFVVTLNDSGKVYLAASRTNNAGDCGQFSVQVFNAKVLEEVEYSGIYDSALAGGGWSGSAFTFDFGTELANKTVKVTMQVAGTADLDGQSKLGFYGYDENGNSLGITYELSRAQVSSFSAWSEATFIWNLDEEGKFNTVMAATASDYENYHLFIKGIVYEDITKDELGEYDYKTSTSGWTGSLVELDFSNVEGIEAEAEVVITMKIYGEVAEGASTATILGFTSWTTAGDDGVHRGYFKFDKEIRSSQWREVEITIKLSEAKKIYLAASRTGNEGSNVSFTIYMKDVSVTPVEKEPEKPAYDYKLSTSNWCSADGIEIDFSNVEGVEAESKVTFKMDILGEITSEGTAILGLTAYDSWENDAKHLGYFAFDSEIRSGEWKTVTVTVKLNAVKAVWFGASRTSNDGTATGFTIYMKNVQFVEVEQPEPVEPEHDYKTSTENWGGTYFELDFSAVEGVEAESTITFKMDILGQVTSDGTAKIGFTSYTTNDDNGVHRGYFAYDSEIRSGEWTTVEMTIKLSEAKKIWLAASRTGNDGTATGFTIYMKNVQFVEVIPVHDYKTSTTNWSGNFIELDFSGVEGVEAESKITFKMDVLGKVTSDGTTTIGFTSYTGNGTGNHRGYFAFNSELRSGEWKTVEMTIQLNEAKTIWLAASRTGNDGTATAFTIYIKNVQFVEVIPEHDYKSSTTGWAGSFFELDFSDVEGVEAESKVTFKMDILGKVAEGADTRTPIGFTTYTGNDTGSHRGYFAYSDELRAGEWKTVEMTVQLSEAKAIWLAASRTGNTGSNVAFTVYIKNVQFVEVIPEYDYKTSTTGWTGELVELDFSDVEGIEAEAEVKIQMQILGKVAEGADTATELGFTSWSTADDDGEHRGYFAFNNEIRSGEWETVELTIKLSEAKKIYLAASRTSGTGSNVTFTIYMKGVSVSVIEKEPEKPAYDYKLSTSNWCSADGIEIDFSNVEGVEAESKVTFKMDILGEITSEGTAILGLTAYDSWENDAKHLGYFAFDSEIRSGEWKTVTVTVKLNAVKAVWFGASRTSNDGAATGFTIYMKNVQFVEVVLEYDYKLSTSNWCSADGIEIDFSGVEGVEAESTITFKMDILGKVTSEGTTTLGLTAWDSWENDAKHLGYFTFDEEIRSGEWKTVEITVKLNEVKAVWFGASRTSNDGTATAFTVYIKNVQFVEVVNEQA